MSKHIPSFTRSYWAENWDRTFRDWEHRQAMVGVALLVLALLGYGWIAKDETMALVGVYAAASFLLLKVFVMTPASMWNDAREEIGRHRERMRPRMSFSFDPEHLPYLQHFPLSQGGKIVQVTRMHRVGITNESGAIIRNVRVVLEACEFLMDGARCSPSTTHPMPIEHALNVMGIDRKDGIFNLAPGDRPTAFIDVVEQRGTPEGKAFPSFMLCYATSVRVPINLDPGPWVITLRAECAGAHSRADFKLEKNAESGALVMSPYSLNRQISVGQER